MGKCGNNLNLNIPASDGNTAQTVLSTPQVTKVKPPNVPMLNYSFISTMAQSSSLSLPVILTAAYREVTTNLSLESHLAFTHPYSHYTWTTEISV